MIVIGFSRLSILLFLFYYNSYISLLRILDVSKKNIILQTNRVNKIKT